MYLCILLCYGNKLNTFIFQSRQAHIVIPLSYPDELSAFISEEEAKTFFNKLNNIFKVCNNVFCVQRNMKINFRTLELEGDF